MASKPVLTIIGSLNADLVTYTPRIPAGGETMTANGFHVGYGGKGANQAVACAKLSRARDAVDDGTAVVKMVGAVGSDGYGSNMLSGLKNYGVDTSGVTVVAGANTGVAVILVEEGKGENRIMLSPEANHTLQPEHFQELADPLPSLIIMQLEIPIPTVLQILKAAKQRNVPVLLNPAPAVELPADCYPSITHLVVNESEAMVLSGCSEQDLETPEGLRGVAQGFKAKGAENILITLGGNGVYYYGSDGRDGLVAAEKVQVVDTTAAGDTFVGAYALEACTAGFDIEAAVKKANLAAAKTVQRKGAQDSIPWLDELRQ